MSTTLRTHFRGIPPRVLLRYRDNKVTRIPTVARTVSTSDRSGNFNIGPFNDMNTIIFNVTGAISPEEKTFNPVLYPIKLNMTDAIKFGLYISGTTENGLASNFHEYYNNSGAYRSSPNTVIAGISDEFIDDTITTHRSLITTQSYFPYREVSQFGQGNTSSFYATGTYADVGPGFSSPLSSKTQITLTLPIQTKYTFLSQTASIAYYDTTAQTFVLTGNVTNPSDAFANTARADRNYIQPGRTPTGSAMNYGYDSRLFGPWGSPVVTGTIGDVRLNSYAGGYNAPSDKFGVARLSVGELNTTILGDIIGNGQYLSASVTKNRAYASTARTALQLNEVQHPFVIEKAVIEIPMSASSNWLNDRTTHLLVESYDRDFGGPCITFGLMHEISPTHRNIILSATVIPIGDAISQSYTSVQTTQPFVGASSDTTAQGFLAYGKPSATISGTNGNFIGNVRMEAIAAITNGCLTTYSRTSPAAGASNFNASEIRALTPFGRAMDRTPSGRSIFGKEFTFPISNGFKPALSTDVSSINVDTFIFEQHAFSPYVILPGDKLIFSVSKHRSVVTNPQSASAGNRTLLSASHDVAIDVGTARITLYGSLVREGHEVFQPRNEPLVTNMITEVIGSADVFDQFDVAPRTSFSGSYTDDFVSGAIGSLSVNAVDTRLDGRRGVKISSVRDKPDMIASDLHQVGFGGTALKRHVNLRTDNEIYFDSLVPAPHEIQSVDGGDSLIMQILNIATGDIESTNTIIFPLRSDASREKMQTLIGPGAIASQFTENKKWPLGYPFESRYGSLLRRLTPRTKNISNTAFVYDITGSAAYSEQSQSFLGNGESIMRCNIVHNPDNATLALRTASIDFLQNTTIVSPTSGTFNLSWKKDEFEKGFYGFGDFIGNQPVWKLFTTGTVGNNLSQFNRAALIRGWKYGLFSGTPQKTKLQFRRSSYGQFRDMLEQRIYTRFVTKDAKLSQSPIKVRFMLTSSYDTSSSNMSTEATSSLPYFDGISRNR